MQIRAELIVTGDRKHLLPIGTHQGIAMVTAREVVDRLEARLKTWLRRPSGGFGGGGAWALTGRMIRA